VIDPHNPYNPDRTDDDLLRWLVFGIMVAGKNADATAKKLRHLEREMRILEDASLTDPQSPFRLSWWQRVARDIFWPNLGESKNFVELFCRCVFNGYMPQALRRAKVGKYKLLEGAFAELAYRVYQPASTPGRGYRNFYLHDATVEDLMEIPGIGPKTARMYVLYTRRDAKVAVLDTHILRYLRDIGYDTAPHQTPSAPGVYAYWEGIFLGECEKADMRPDQLDIQIWRMYSGGYNIRGERIRRSATT
jgi:hypothetical protein